MGHSIPIAWLVSHAAAMGAGFTTKMAVYQGKPPKPHEGDPLNPVNRYAVGPAAGAAAGYAVNAALGDPVGAGVTAATTAAQAGTHAGAAAIGSTLAEWTVGFFR